MYLTNELNRRAEKKERRKDGSRKWNLFGKRREHSFSVNVPLQDISFLPKYAISE